MPIFYECQRCTACCRWPGEVGFSEGENARLAAFMGMSEHEFTAPRESENPWKTSATEICKRPIRRGEDTAPHLDYFERKAGGTGANILNVSPSTVEPPE
jgi:hypothetical protein